MSEFSYQMCRELGVTGPNTRTCLPAAFDRISTQTAVAPTTYERYNAAMQVLHTNRNTLSWSLARSATRDCYRDLGVASTKDVVHNKAKTVDQLQAALGSLSANGYRIVVAFEMGDTGLHAVGVIPVEPDYCLLRSTWAPFPDDEPVYVGDFFPYMNQTRRQLISSKSTNVTALPPER